MPTGVNTDPLQQRNAKLRELNREPSVPGSREEVYCTKVGVKHPEEMYILGARTWMAMVGVKRQTTTAPALRS